MKPSLLYDGDDPIDQYVHPPPPRRPMKFLRAAAAVVGLCSIAVGVTGFLWLRDLGVMSITEGHIRAITNYEHADNTIVLDRDGAKIGEFFSSYYIFWPYEKLPKFLVNAVIAVEDRNFYHHHGIDFRGIARAALVHLGGHPYSQGASTITQQIVRNFLLSPEKTMERKVKEIALALHLERKLSKEKLFEIYSNALFLGNGAYGVGAAARRYFGRSLQELEPHELAVIAGLFQSPSRYNPRRYPQRAKARQRQVLQSMVTAGMLSDAERRRLIAKPLVYLSYENVNLHSAPYFVDYVRDQTEQILDKGIKNRGLRIYTSLDIRLQRQAQQAIVASQPVFTKAESMFSPDRSPRPGARVEAAILVTEPRTGQVLAMVGGRDYTKSQFNRTVSSQRSPGSAFKPVVYAEALRRGWKWSDVIYVAPIAVDDYRPRNVDGDYLSETTLLRGFYKSINTVTVEVGAKVGLSNVIRMAQTLGVKTPMRDEVGALIGASEVSMLDMATLYGTFANQGTRVDPVSVLKITDREGHILYEAPKVVERSHEALLPAIAHLMVQGMRAVFLYGTAYSRHKWAAVAAGKTGTSNDARDNWFCGFTPNLVTIVWLGTDEPNGFYGPAGGNTLALPVWDEFMKQAVTVYKPTPFVVPENVVTAKVHPQFGHLDDGGIEMSFLRGQEPVATESDLEIVSSGGGYRNLFDY